MNDVICHRLTHLLVCPLICLLACLLASLQIIAGPDNAFTFDYVFGIDTQQHRIYDDCVTDLIDGRKQNASILYDTIR